MLVASESMTKVAPAEGYRQDASSVLLKPDRIMRIPMKASNAKAIQWSNGAMKRSTVDPTSQPKSGISAWNNPKWNESRKAGRGPLM